MKNRISEVKVGIILSYTSLVVGNVIGIVYTPVMIRLLGQSEYGLYNLVASFVSYLGLLNFGFDNTYLRFYTQFKQKETDDKVASLNGMFLAVFSMIGLLAGFCGIVLYNFAGEMFGENLSVTELATAKKLLILLVINMVVSFPANMFKTYINANEKFIFAKLVNIIRTVVNPLIVLPLLLLGYKSYALVMSTLICSFSIDIINIYYCFNKLEIKFKFKNFELKVFRGIAIFSFFVFLGEIVDEINWQLDKVLLGRYRGTIAVAIYGVASNLSGYFRQLSTCISSMFGPRINKIVASSNDNTVLTNLMIKVGRIQFLVLGLVAVGFVVCGQEFCVLWAGENYADSYPIAIALMLPSIIPLIQNTGISILTARNKHRFRSVAYFFIAIFNVAVSIPLCQLMGGVGCAIGTGMSMLIGNGIIINWYYFKIGIDVKRFWISILSLMKGGIPLIVLGVVFSYFDSSYSWSHLLIRILTCILVYFVGMFFIGMNDEEKRLFQKVIRKLKLKRK